MVAATEPPASAAPIPSESPAATPAPAASTTTWDEAFSRDNFRFGAMIVWRDGFVVPGCEVEPEDSFCQRNFVLTSPDGSIWTTTEMPVAADLGFQSLHVVGDRLIALGYGHYFTADYAGGAMVVTSTDGRTWTRVESPSFRDRALDNIVETPFGTFAVGYNAFIDSDNASGFLLWPVRPDGTFRKPRVIETPDGPPLVSRAAWFGDEFLAWGGTHGPYGGPPIVIASKDGVDWKVRSTMRRAENADLSDLVAFGDRLVAVGHEGRQYPLTPSARFSDDVGRTWTTATVEGDDAAMFDVRVEGDRLIARGRISYAESSRPISWESEDGETWTRLPADSDLPDLVGYSPYTRATLDGRTCVADSLYSGETFRGAIYCR